MDRHATVLRTAFFGRIVGQLLRLAVAHEPKADRWNGFYKMDGDSPRKDWTESAAGYTGVWATSDTRGALWDAMKRRGTYASSSPRITVRFFAGYDFTAADAVAARLVQAGYQRGVPMDGDLKAAPAGKVPKFLIAGHTGPSRCEPRPRPGDQGRGGRGRQAARSDL